MTVRVLLADDEELVRTGLRMILGVEPDLEVVGEGADGAQALELVTTLAPDVLLLDIRMPGLDGPETTRRLQASGTATRTVILTTFSTDNYVYEALCAGACGFLLKDARRPSSPAPSEPLLPVTPSWAPSVTRRVVEELARAQAPAGIHRLTALTPREQEVLGLMALGRSNAEIAADLTIGVGTVKTHVARILMKLGVRDRLQAVVVAYQAGGVS